MVFGLYRDSTLPRGSLPVDEQPTHVPCLRKRGMALVQPVLSMLGNGHSQSLSWSLERPFTCRIPQAPHFGRV